MTSASLRAFSTQGLKSRASLTRALDNPDPQARTRATTRPECRDRVRVALVQAHCPCLARGDDRHRGVDARRCVLPTPFPPHTLRVYPTPVATPPAACIQFGARPGLGRAATHTVGPCLLNTVGCGVDVQIGGPPRLLALARLHARLGLPR
jgi:hypothetical protein